MFQRFFEGYQALELNLDYYCHWNWEFGIIGSFKGESLEKPVWKSQKIPYETH